MDEVAELQKTKVKGKGHMAASLLSAADWAAPVRTGWISKEGANRKSVKKRFFVLQGTKMIYFKSSELTPKAKPIGFFILEPGSKVALMPRDTKEKGLFKWRVLTPSRTWEFMNDTEEEMKGWVRVIARIVNPEITFGLPLATIVARSKRRGGDIDVPGIIVKLIQFLQDNDGVNVEGIFRLSGDQNAIKQLKSRFNSEPDNTIVIEPETDVHVVTGTLKYFLRELETPLIPLTFNSLLRAICTLRTSSEKIVGFKKLVDCLPRENAATLQYILKYLFIISQNCSTNKMTTQNLAVVFGPCFIRSEADAPAFQDADMQLNSVNSMIETYPSIFENETLITPSKGGNTALQSSGPSSGFKGPNIGSVPQSTSVVIGHNTLPPPPTSNPLPPTGLPPAADQQADPKRGNSRPPNFAPPAVPPYYPPESTETAEPEYTMEDSSSDEEAEVAHTPRGEFGFVVTSFDDLGTEMEEEQTNSSSSAPKESNQQPLSSPPASNRNRTNAGAGWVPVAKPSNAPPVHAQHDFLAHDPITKSDSQSSIGTGSGSPSPAPASAAGNEDVATWMAALGEDFIPYVTTLQSEGFKIVKQLLDLTEDDMKELGIKMAHRKSLRAEIDKLKASM